MENKFPMVSTKVVFSLINLAYLENNISFIKVLLSGTPRVRIAPGTPKSLKTKRFQAFLFPKIQTMHEAIYLDKYGIDRNP